MRKDMFEEPVSKWFRAPIRNISVELLKLFCELVASAEASLGEPGARRFFIRLVSKMDAELLAWLFEKRFPLRPFLDKIDPKRLFPCAAGPSRGLRKRWRLLKKRLYSAPRANSALDTTLADLRPLVSLARRGEPVRAAWRTHGKAVTARPAAAPDAFSPVMIHPYWGGVGSRQIAYWERLVHSQAGELSEIRRLSHEVSRRTGRVVLSWHNATLGAAGGWAFDDPAVSFESPEVYSSFVREVLREAVRIRESFDRGSAMRLCSMRTERLFAPKLAHLVENSSVAARAGEPGDEDGNKHEWPGALALHQRITKGQVFEWIESARKSWAEGLILLFALANQGQRMLDSGVIDSMALPWIDKFFISSRRQADVAY